MKPSRMSLFYLCIFMGLGIQTILGQAPVPADDIEFKIVMPQQIYDPGATAKAWLLVMNRGTLPIYISRHFVYCSNPSVEYAEVTLLDRHGRDVGTEKKCAEEIFLSHPIADLLEAKGWIELKPGEAYGSEADISLPSQRGKYRVESELFPPGLYQDYKEELARRQIRVLRNSHKANSVVIDIR